MAKTKDLRLAVRVGHEFSVRALLQAGADASIVDENGQTILMHAVYGGSVECVKMVLPLVDVNRQDDDGKTALSYAASDGNVSLVKLLKKQIDPLLGCAEGKTALHDAVLGGSMECVRALLECTPGNVVDYNGSSALHLAAHEGSVPMLRLLLEHVDPNMVDRDGFRALDRSLFEGHVESVKVLLPLTQLDEEKQVVQALHHAALSTSRSTMQALLGDERIIKDVTLMEGALKMCKMAKMTGLVEDMQAVKKAVCERTQLERNVRQGAQSSSAGKGVKVRL